MKIESLNQPGELWLSSVTLPSFKDVCCQQVAGCCQRVSAPVYEVPNT